jgi:hypothetical protein
MAILIECIHVQEVLLLAIPYIAEFIRLANQTTGPHLITHHHSLGQIGKK